MFHRRFLILLMCGSGLAAVATQDAAARLRLRRHSRVCPYVEPSAASREVLLDQNGLDRIRVDSLYCSLQSFAPGGRTAWFSEGDTCEARALLIAILSQPECSGPSRDDPDIIHVFQYCVSRKEAPHELSPDCLIYLEGYMHGVFCIMGRKAPSADFHRIKYVQADEGTVKKYHTLFEKVAPCLGPN
jgi:hypothetical protein